MVIQDLSNIKAAFNKPVPRMSATSKPVSTPIPSFQNPLPKRSQPQKPTEAKKPEPGFSLVDFSKNQTLKGDQIYRTDFRYKTRDALKGTLKNYADRDTVANLLWDKRGSGINKDEVKSGLRKLEKDGKLSSDQVRAVRRKMGIY